VYVPGEQIGNLWNEFRGKSTANQRRNLDNLDIVAIAGSLPRSRQRDAALLAGSIDGEKKHKG
jgi:hypothetical protein